MHVWSLKDSLSTQSTVLPTVSEQSTLNIYACGITPYDDAHVGHARSYVLFDALADALRTDGYTVAMVRNITDIDDKIIAKAQQLGWSWNQVSEHYAAKTRQLMQATHLSVPQEPKASHYLSEMFTIIQGLIQMGLAYESQGSVWYRVGTYQGAALMHHQQGSLRSEQGHSRVNTSDKEQAQDFALWKAQGSDQVGFNSPWGWGRPGWHIECSAMIGALFGAHVDIHGGGVDLKFPHHQAEIMQSEPYYGKRLAKVWMHNGSVLSDGKKMSKSLGNTVLWHTLLEQAARMHHEPGTLVKLAFLQTHWGKPMDWTDGVLHNASVLWKRLHQALIDPITMSSEDYTRAESEVLCILRNNFNVPALWGAWGALKDPIPKKAQAQVIQKMWHLHLHTPAPAIQYPPHVLEWMHQRAEAKKERNFPLADALRKHILDAGFEVQDPPVS